MQANARELRRLPNGNIRDCDSDSRLFASIGGFPHEQFCQMKKAVATTDFADGADKKALPSDRVTLNSPFKNALFAE